MFFETDTGMTPIAASRENPKGRLLLADGNPEILEDVFQALEHDYEIVAAVGSGADVLAYAEKTRPDLIVLDISLGDMSGIEVARKLRSQKFAGKVVFLTVHEDKDFVAAALAVGAQGYVVKSRLASDLVEAIGLALSGAIFVSPNLGIQVSHFHA